MRGKLVVERKWNNLKISKFVYEYTTNAIDIWLTEPAAVKFGLIEFQKQSESNQNISKHKLSGAN